MSEFQGGMYDLSLAHGIKTGLMNGDWVVYRGFKVWISEAGFTSTKDSDLMYRTTHIKCGEKMWGFFCKKCLVGCSEKELRAFKTLVSLKSI